MRWHNWKIVLCFMFSPFLGGIFASIVMYFYFDDLRKTSLLECLSAAVMLGLLGVLYFSIPAIATGFVYLKTIKWNRLLQELLCCTMGFIFSFLWARFILGDFFSNDVKLFHWYMGLNGLITAFFVSSMLNYKVKKKYHRI